MFKWLWKRFCSKPEPAKLTPSVLRIAEALKAGRAHGVVMRYVIVLRRKKPRTIYYLTHPASWADCERGTLVLATGQENFAWTQKASLRCEFVLLSEAQALAKKRIGLSGLEVAIIPVFRDAERKVQSNGENPDKAEKPGAEAESGPAQESPKDEREQLRVRDRDDPEDKPYNARATLNRQWRRPSSSDD